MRSWWSRAGPKPSDWHPCKERELWKQTLTKREDSLVETKTEIGVVQPRAKEDGGLLATILGEGGAGRARQESLWSLQREHGPADILISDS